MGPSPNIPYSPAAHTAPATLLPEEVFGYIDVATLADIHRYLGESEAQDDIDLAAWIQDNYLYGVEKDQATAIIRTSQGFAQLDRAYRRVRSLTNKAQDKWPFFDRNFKEMSSATVRNNARGEAAPGVLYPIDSAQKAMTLTEQPGATSTSNGLDTSGTSLAPELQVPFVPVEPSGDQVHKQDCTRLARQTSVPLPSSLPTEPMQQSRSEMPSIHPENPAKDHSECSEKKAAVKNQTKIESEGQQSTAPSVKTMPDSDIQVTNAANKDINKETLGCSQGLQSNTNDEDVKPDLIRDAGRGKVRGRNGQYLPKEKVLPSGKKAKKPKGKGEKLSPRTDGTSGLDATQPSPEKSDNIFVQVQTPSTPPPDQNMREQSTTTAAAILAVSDTTPPLSAVTEAENHVAPFATPTPTYILAAEAEAVPSNLDRLPPNSRKAIKRKSESTGQEGERKRGKYGGIVGRPRKSEQREASKAVEEKSPKTEKIPPLQMTTRRSARRSAISSSDGPESTEVTEGAAGKDSKQEQNQAKNEALAEKAPINKITETSHNDMKDGSDSVGHVELFARLMTSHGIMEIAIPADRVNSDEVQMLQKYAAWNAQPNTTAVPYDQFRQIVSFAKKD